VLGGRRQVNRAFGQGRGKAWVPVLSVLEGKAGEQSQ
jgi:hypothetical protein